MPLSSTISILVVEDRGIMFRVSSKILTKRGRLNVKETKNVEVIIQSGQKERILHYFNGWFPTI